MYWSDYQFVDFREICYQTELDFFPFFASRFDHKLSPGAKWARGAVYDLLYDALSDQSVDLFVTRCFEVKRHGNMLERLFW